MLFSYNHNNINNNSTYTNTKHNRETQIHRRLFCSGTNGLLISDFGSSTRGEKQFLEVFRNHTMLTTPPTLGTSHGPISISQHHGRTQVLTIMVGPPTSTVCLNGRQPNCLPTCPKVNSSGSSLPGITSFTLQPHFLSGVYYDNYDCHILCARA